MISVCERWWCVVNERSVADDSSSPPDTPAPCACVLVPLQCLSAPPGGAGTHTVKVTMTGRKARREISSRIGTATTVHDAASPTRLPFVVVFRRCCRMAGAPFVTRPVCGRSIRGHHTRRSRSSTCSRSTTIDAVPHYSTTTITATRENAGFRGRAS